MKFMGWTVAVTLIASVMPALAQDRAGKGLPSFGGQDSGPLSLIYVVSGVRDDAGADRTGIATSFHCTNASSAPESLQIIVRSFSGEIVGNQTFTLTSARTFTVSTHAAAAFNQDANVSSGFKIDQGVAFIFASTQFMFCSAMMTNAGSVIPAGISLHMVRFSPLAGTSE
jgi:hypothetical protein